MLQPRRRRQTGVLLASYLLFLVLIRSVLGNEKEAYSDAEDEITQLGKETILNRFKRDDSGLTTVLLINNDDADARGGRNARPSGILTSTARTFVHDGTTTEYGTQVIGTTLDHGKYYAQLLRTSSRIYFGSAEKSATKSKPDERAFYKSRFIGLPQTVDNFIQPSFFQTFQPSEPVFIYPTGRVANPFNAVQSDNLQNTFLGVLSSYDSKSRDHNNNNNNKENINSNNNNNNNNNKEIFVTQNEDYGQNANRPKETGEREVLENLIRLEKVDIFNNHNINEIKPTKVFSNQLPTVTIRHDFAPSGFSVTPEEKKEERVVKSEKSKLRSGKSLIAKPTEKKYDTVTYMGFADFVTTVGSTVIVFMPNTRPGDQTVKKILATDEINSKKSEQQVKTTIKTFLSHSPGMVTKTIPGHSISMQTTLPTSVADRKSKALGEDLELKSSVLAKEQILFENPVYSSEILTESSEFIIEPSESMTYSSISRTSQTATEPLATFATTVTRTFHTGEDEKPLGLLKSIGGTKAYNGTTTHFTSLIYGTLVDGSYAQILKTSSSVYSILDDTETISATVVYDTLDTQAPEQITTQSDAPQTPETTFETPETTFETPETTNVTPASTEGEDELLETSDPDYEEEKTTSFDVTTESMTESGEIEKPSKIDFEEKEPTDDAEEDEEKSEKKESLEKPETFQTADEDLITRLVPSTVYKTFTYLTTFFIPADETTTTSIRSREVVTSDVNLVTKIIDPNLVSKEVFPTSSVFVTTEGFTLDGDDADEEFQLPDVRILAPEEIVVIEDTEIDEPAKEDNSKTTTNTEEPVTKESSIATTEKPITERAETGTTLSETPTETTQDGNGSPITPPLETTENTLTTTKDLEKPEEQTKSSTNKTVASSESDDEEIEVIFKTLYTTYTYLTTFFHESTTSISSSEVVVTNIITSTLDVTTGSLSTQLPQSTPVIKEAIESTKIAEDEGEEFGPTSVVTGGSETKFFDDDDDDDDDEDDEDEDVFSLSPSREISEIEVTKTPALEISGFKTLYTTYTYYTTLFDEGSTEVQSRVEVVTNVVGPNSVSVLPSSILQNEALLKSKFEMLLREQQSLRAAASRSSESPSSTVLKSSPVTSSLHSSVRPGSSVHRFSSPSLQSSSSFPSKLKSDSSRITSSTRGTSFQKFSIRPSASVKGKFSGFTRKYKDKNSLTLTKTEESNPTESEEDNSVTRLIIKGDKKDRTVIRKRVRTKAKQPSKGTDVDDNLGITTIKLDPTPAEEEKVVLQTMVTDVKSSSSSGGRRQIRIAPPEPVERIGEFFYDDQISSESNTDEIEPSPTLILQTSYTTFTYFTTVYKGTSSSDVISRLETVTNIVTETVKPELLATQDLSPEDATLPITYFTTFTYWTTLYKDGSTTITSREETVSNVVTPTIDSTSTSVVQQTVVQPVLIQPTSSSSIPAVISSIFIPGFIPITTTDPVTEAAQSENSSPINAKPADNFTDLLIKQEGFVGKLEPTTYYTTYTYFTTSYIGDKTELKSRLETVTNVIIPTPTISEILVNDLQTGRAVQSGPPDATTKSEKKENSESLFNSFQTGLLSTVVSSTVQDGKTTLYSTDIFGTFIDGLYAKVLESTTKIISTVDVKPTPSSEIQKTGVVSINEGKIIDADGVSTTFFTTKAIGTSIEELYAQVVESTTSVLIDNDKKSSLASLQQGQTEDNPTKTGLLLLTEGSIIQDGTTTLYESRLIGKIIDGRYVQVVESSSSIKIEASIAPSVTITSEVSPTTTIELTSPSPSTVEGSIVDETKVPEEEHEDSEEYNEEGGEDDKDKGRVKSRLTFQTKKRTFTPVIRPFASRNRPTFLPKKKPIGTTGAQTITRANFTPTITATLAAKTEGFSGSSRNRFGSGRKSSSSFLNSDVKPTASSSRKFGRSRSSFAYSSPTISSTYSPSRGRASSGRVSATPTLNLNSARSRANFRGSSSRAAFNFESGVLRSSLAVGRPRIRPTLSGLPGRGFSGATALTNPPNDKDNDLTTVVTEDDEEPYTLEDEGATITTAAATTTEDPNLARRNNNPLLRFRRPLLPKAQPTTPPPKPPTTQAPRRGILGGRNNRLPAVQPSGNTTPRSRTPVNFGRSNLPGRSKPVNSLFPPRGLFKKPSPQEVEKEEDEFFDEEEEEDIENEDNNYEESSAKEIETESDIKKNDRGGRGRTLNPVNIRPFSFQRRSKRQVAEHGSRNKQLPETGARYRRPKAKPAQAQERIDYYDDDVTPSETPKTSRNGRVYTPRNRPQSHQAATTNPPVQPRIRPTTASSQNSPRAPFTLREKDTTSNPRSTNFRRGQTSTRRKSTSFKGTESTTRKSSRPRAQSQNQALNDLTRTNQRRGYSNSNRRVSPSRSRPRFGESEEAVTYQPSTFDGTIVVTHKIPSEVTIPIVSGKVTEYRNVITAKPSTEILGPHQYTVSQTNGGTVLILNREVTETLNNGFTEITKFIIHETPTTSVIFTPTTIRGRKTSFSHVVPSTVYDVENVVSTIQPPIAANAPLANILLSQLLLGNLNVPANQPLGIPQQPNAVTPTTEYKTRTTSYVTTVTDHISTVLPITFRGKEILTTIVDDTVNVITATEYITDTIVVTPSLSPNQQINSLLLPALLQAQLLNSNQQVPPPQLPIPAFTQLPFTQLPFSQPFTPPIGLDQLKFESLPQQDIRIEDAVDGRPKVSRDNDIRLERESDSTNIDEEVEPVKISHKPKGRKKSRKRVEHAHPEPAKEIVTLYVSGRRPGEFSTILSTVTIGETSVAVRKREAALDDVEKLLVEASEVKQVRVLASKELTLDDENSDRHQTSYLDYYVTPGIQEVVIPVETEEFNSETQSLESVLGDVSKHVTGKSKPTSTMKASVKPTRNEYQKKVKKSSAKPFFSKPSKENF